MSAKIVAYTPYVKDYVRLLEQNLMLPIEELYNPKYYYPGFEPYFLIYDVLWDTLPIGYFWYFHKNQNLRNQYFDVIRAIGGNEMWVMSEYVTDALEEDSVSISDFLECLSKQENFYSDNSAPIKEFNVDDFTFDEKGFCTNYDAIYHDTFKDCFEKVAAIEKQYDVYVLGLHKFEEKYIRVVLNDGVSVKLLNPEIGEFKMCDL
ncbi:MAG: hypothetical protein IJP79_03980 [Paludibacteraceae bacterium]|nr:hypothetical protein [Paludibacteraceae bacterium]